MATYIIIEIDRGLTVAEVAADQTPETVASTRGGVVIDPGPYGSVSEAYEVLMTMPIDEESRHDIANKMRNL